MRCRGEINYHLTQFLSGHGDSSWITLHFAPNMGRVILVFNEQAIILELFEIEISFPASRYCSVGTQKSDSPGVVPKFPNWPDTNSINIYLNLAINFELRNSKIF